MPSIDYSVYMRTRLLDKVTMAQLIKVCKDRQDLTVTQEGDDIFRVYLDVPGNLNAVRILEAIHRADRWWDVAYDLRFMKSL